MSEHEPTDNHELIERVERLYTESDRIIVAIFSKYVDSLKSDTGETNEESS